MASVCTLFLLQLSLLLLSSSISVHGVAPVAAPPAHSPHPHPGHHHHHAPTPAPTKPPVKPPVNPPVRPPVKPPVHPPVSPPVKPPVHPPVKPPASPPVSPPPKPPVKPKMVEVQGVVYCKSCKYRGKDTLTGAAPLLKAVVQLECNNTKKTWAEQTQTDKNGYFRLKPKRLTTSGYHKCKVSLFKSPAYNCTVPTNLHGGAAGAPLVPSRANYTDPKYVLFSVGPFAFEPHKKLRCRG